MQPVQKNAVVTGGASGLGRAICVRLAQDGWRVAVCDINLEGAKETAALVADAGGDGRPIELDVADLDAWRALEARLRGEWNAIDLLVNNAGVAGSGAVSEYPIEDWKWILNVNLWSVIQGCDTFIPWLKENPTGAHIINTSSVAAIATVPFMAAYNVTKAGILALSESLYAELKDQNVGRDGPLPVVLSHEPVEGRPLHARVGERTGRRRIPQVAVHRRIRGGPGSAGRTEETPVRRIALDRSVDVVLETAGAHAVHDGRGRTHGAQIVGRGPDPKSKWRPPSEKRHNRPHRGHPRLRRKLLRWRSTDNDRRGSNAVRSQMLILKSDTSPHWVDGAREHLDEVLVDHAHCERKAASVAMQLMFAYQERVELVAELSEIVNEELEHYGQVLELLKSRNIRFRRQRPTDYGKRLHEEVRPHEPHRAVDRLLVASLIEARSCERFSVLAEALDDEELVAFYAGLFAAEARHHSTYVRMARQFVDSDSVAARLEELAEREAEILAQPSELVRMHS